MEHPWIKSAAIQFDQYNKQKPTNKRIGLNESAVLQPSIIREFREREGEEIVAEQSPERQVTISRKKASKNPEPFGIKINNLNPTSTTTAKP